MIINKAFKYRIYPNARQREFLANSFGCTRFVYNYFLRQHIDTYAETGKGSTYCGNSSSLTQLKKQLEFEWLNDVSAQSLQQALRNLDTAYNNFFNKRTQFPKFKKKSNKQSFRVPQDFSIHDNLLDIPKCKGIKIKLHRNIEGNMKSITISKTPSGKYYASVLCELEIPNPVYSGGELGIDYGVKVFITTSDGTTIDSPKYLRKSEVKLKRLQRTFCKKHPTSKNRYKAQKQLAKTHEHVANQRADFQHKLSNQLTRDNQTIYVESLSISNMVQNHNLAKSISDSGWSAFVSMLKYKGKWYGCHIVEIDRWFPSSKRCHVCGYINDNLTLNDRSWVCPECSTNLDRDHNAAINILIFGRAGVAQTTDVSASVNACGEGSPSQPVSVEDL
jgi:putative transposase